jgi:hypothetical protein
MPPIPPLWSAADQDRREQADTARIDSQDSIISCKLPFGSISIAYRLSNPLTLVASLPNFWENASERL